MMKTLTKRLLTLMFAGCLLLCPVTTTQTANNNPDMASTLDDDVIILISPY